MRVLNETKTCLYFYSQTPDGTVKLNHWVIVYKEDEKKGIKVAPKLKNMHFLSEGYITMNVGLAFSVRKY